MRLHVREEARVFAPPFHFCRGIATEPANSLADPPSPRTRVGQKGRLLPHEAPFSFSGRPPPGVSRKVLARLREHRIPRVLPWPEHRHATAWPLSRPPTPSVSWSISPTA